MDTYSTLVLVSEYIFIYIALLEAEVTECFTQTIKVITDTVRA